MLTGGLPTAISTTPDWIIGLRARFRTTLEYLEWLNIKRWEIAGIEKDSRESVSILYTGLEQNKNYFVRQLFGGDYSETRLSFLHACSPKNYSMKVTEGLGTFESWYHSRGYIYIPGWVKGIIELPEDFTKLKRNRSLNSDLNHIRRDEFEYLVTTDPAWFDRFYYRMFVPLVTNRHGGRGFLNSYEEMRQLFKKSVLLIITKGGVAVGGCMVSAAQTQGRLWIMGVTDGDAAYIRQGVLSAIYYYSIKYLHAQGCRTINVGMARSFLNDGILNYKKKWGVKITGVSPAGYYLKVLQNTIGVNKVLHHNPFITRVLNYNTVVFFSDGSMNNPEPEAVRKELNLPNGLDSLDLYSLDEDGRIHLTSRCRKL